LRIVGVKVHFDFIFASLCSSQAVFVKYPMLKYPFSCADIVELRHSPGSLLVLDFDILVGSDGTHSKLRQEVNGSLETMSRFKFHKGSITFKPDHPLIGRTLIARYKLTNGSCPEIKPHHKDNPFAVAFRVSGVSSTFKRFFFNHCEVQIAFDEWAVTNGNESDVPWELLLSVSQEVMTHPPADLDSLKGQLLDHPKLLQIPVRRIKPSSVIALSENKHVIFIGDSQVSALYRLATGVNFIISNVPHFRRIFQASSSHTQWRRFQQTIDSRIDELISSQLTALFLESVCGLVVFQDEIWRYDENRHFQGPLSSERALARHCNTSSVPKWYYTEDNPQVRRVAA
jgi:hypothetical protein